MTATVASEQVRRFRVILARQLGWRLDAGSDATLAELLGRRAAARGGSHESYLGQLAAGTVPEEVGALATELTVGETYFFRNVEQFRALADVVLPARMAAREWDRRLRVLSAGCASGEEAYTIAMVVREVLPDPSWQVSILGVDVNPAMVGRARRGSYSSWALRATPVATRQRWFSPEAKAARIDESIRRMVTFAQHNLMDGDPQLWRPGTYDAIFCRNVLMYFDPDGAQTVVAKLARALAPGGFLFLGHAETLRGMAHDLELRHTHDTFYYQRPPDGVAAPPAPVAAPPGLAYPAVAGDEWAVTIGAAANRIQAMTQVRPPARRRGSPAQLPVPVRPPTWSHALDLLRGEQFAAAIEVVEGFPGHVWMRPDVLVLYAVLLVQAGQLDRAEEVCGQLLELDGLNAGAHYLLASCRASAGDGAEAMEHHRMAAYLDPGFAMPRLHLGLLARQRGDRDLAWRELERTLALLPREDSERIVLFGGGFTREALIALCRTELRACGSPW